MALIQAIPFSFAALFPVVNPIGSSVIFASIAHNASAQELKVLAFKIALYAATLLIVVLFVGSSILRAFGITIPVVLIGGGLVLAYIGWQLLNEPTSSRDGSPDAPTLSDSQANAMAFFPLTMPITAGPGCIAVAIALGAHSIAGSWESTLMNQIGNSIGIILVSISVYFCYRYTRAITQKLGQSGMNVIMRLAAFINLCIGLQLIVHGFHYLLAGYLSA